MTSSYWFRRFAFAFGTTFAVFYVVALGKDLALFTVFPSLGFVLAGTHHTRDVADPAMGEALAALHRRCDRVRFLGSYPRAANGRASGAPGTPVIGPSDADGFAAAQGWLERLRAGTTA